MKKKIMLAAFILAVMLTVFVSCNEDAKTFTITYNANGGFGTPYPQLVVKGTSVTVSNGESMTYKNHDFINWNTERDGSGFVYMPGSTITPHKDLELYAQWTEAFTITFDPNGATGEKTTMFLHKGAKIVVPDGSGMTFEHYDFDSWNTVSDGTGDEYRPGDTYTVTGEHTLYARWRNHLYTVSFDANGGTGTVYDETTFYGGTIEIPSGGFERDGYIFLGWNTAADGTGTTVDPGFVTVTSSYTLYAQWLGGKAVSSESDIDFENGGTFWLMNDVTLSGDRTIAKDLSLGLFGHKLSSQYDIVVAAGAEATFENGSIEACSFQVGNSGKSGAAAELYLVNVGLETTGNVGISLYGTGSGLGMNGTVLSCDGTVGILADNEYTKAGAICMEESLVFADSADNDNCALLVSATDYSTVLDDVLLSGERQGAVIRSGNLSATDSSFLCSGTYSGASYKTEPWGDLNSVPSAALVFGDDNSLATSAYSNSDKTMEGELEDCTFLASGNFDSAIWVESNQEEETTLSIDIAGFNEEQLTSYGGEVLINGQSPFIGTWQASSGNMLVSVTINDDHDCTLLLQDDSKATSVSISDWVFDKHETMSYRMTESSMGTVTASYSAGGDTLKIDSYGLLSGLYRREHAQESAEGTWTLSGSSSTLVLQKTSGDLYSETFSVTYDDEFGNDFTGNMTIDGTDFSFASGETTGENRFRMEEGKLSIDYILLSRV